MTAPLWLADEPWLRALLHWFLDRLEAPRKQAITRRVRPVTLPALFEFSVNTRYRWQLVEALASEYRIFTIHYDTKLSPFQERYENAQLRLNPDCETLLREWLGRPREDPLQAAWRAALAAHVGRFADDGASLLSLQPAMPGVSPAEIVNGFAAAGNLLSEHLTLREISARCFQGNSKFLDQRLDLLHRLFGKSAEAIVARPLLLIAWTPPAFTQLLIVENQDNFLRLVDKPPPDSALLYSGGFRASAGRLASGYSRFAFMPGSDAQRFYEQWLDPRIAAYFWGDMDFTGFGILKGLRGTFPGIEAWPRGYAPMLQYLLGGGGHTPASAAKNAQLDPGTTGCRYSDEVLLPALRCTGRFVDQEAVRPE